MKLVVHCRHAAHLAAESMTRPLTGWEKFQLRWHNFICPPCHKMEGQFSFLRHAVRRIVAEPELKNRLAPEAKERLRAQLSEAARDLDKPAP